MADEVTVTVNGADLAGWTDVRITRRLEGCPNDFEVGCTEAYPGQPTAIQVKAGDSCVVALGGDTVITGYVDRVARGFSAGQHTVALSGRGKTQDLVDCSAEYTGGQLTGTVLSIAQTLAAPYGITVSSLAGPGLTIPQQNINLGESAFDIIERLCRFGALLAYEGTDGNLILANTGSTTAASGFVEGGNVQAAHIVTGMDQRFSEYDAFLLSMDVTGDLGNGGNLLGSAKDPFVPRHRKLYLIAEAGGGGADVAKQRALWESVRRAGRSEPVSISCDSWRDSAGGLWAPNTQALINLPSLKLSGVTWTIGEVTYRLDDAGGTRAEVLLLLPGAFSPAPILLQPTPVDVKPATPTG